MNDIGHNHPPDMTVSAGDVMSALSDWMAENPTIADEDKAREAKKLVDRGKLCIKDLEDERDKKVRPLNEQVKAINATYKPGREALEKVLGELSGRVTAFLRAEEERRIAVAQEAALIAQKAEQAARAAERIEQEAIAEAKEGVLGVNIAGSVVGADAAFAAYQKATHQAAIAEKDTNVRLGGGFLRATSLKDKETLIVVDATFAIAAIGVTQDIKDAILKGARAYRKLHGRLPSGIERETERKI